jgi:hypothetical protein
MADSILTRWRKERDAKRKKAGATRKTLAALNARVRKLNAAIKRRAAALSPVLGIKNGWHPGAMRVQVQAGIGAFIGVPARLVWHTTEGTSLPTYSGSHPHFTLDFERQTLYQHIPITSGAMALENDAGGVETNRAHAIQVELVGFAKDSANWSDADYAEIAKLARWIEKHAGVARRCSVTFEAGVNHMSNSQWLNYSGHCGHQHVPENEHWDPGRLRIDKVI